MMIPTPFRKKVFYFLILFCFLLACDQPKRQDAASKTVDGITQGNAFQEGLDTMRLHEMTAAITGNDYPNIHSVIVIKNNKLVYEQYFVGKDEILGESIGVIHHAQNKLHDIRSITKSVVSSCLGIAIAQKKINSIDQSIWDFFPEYIKWKQGEKGTLTIKHLLTMTSGLEWNENLPYTDSLNSEIQMDNSPDPIEFILSRNLVHSPGKVWNYNGGTTQLLAAIIKKATGQEVDQYARKYLFEPIGVKEFQWLKFRESPNMNAVPLAAAGLRMRSIDLAKFGLLYMNNGMWKDQQILDKSWVRDSHKSHVHRENQANGGYGYQFWTETDTVKGKPLQLAIAVGNGGQRIVFDHKNGLMVVVTAGNYNQWNIKNNTDALIRDFLY